jgi:predicted neuraminidase
MKTPAGGRAWTLASLAALLSCFVVALVREAPSLEDLRFHLESPSASLSSLDLEGETRIVSSDFPPSVHSATAVELSGGRIRAFWYGGSREGAKDVAIYSAVFDPSSREWSPQEVVTTREATARDLGRYLKKLGNPVAFRDARERLWLFYVSVSLGGWSGSAVNFRISEDEGGSWSSARRLTTSPFLNVGTLVRGPAVGFEDGSIGLPVYHELLGKFGELLRISAEGEVLDKIRLSHGRSSLQPVIVPLSSENALAFFRTSGSSPKKVLTAVTGDGGRTWSDPAPTQLPNPDAAVAALRTSAGEILLAFNDSERDRSSLKLAVSRDAGKSFEVVAAVEPPGSEGETQELAYPWLLETKDGSLHLLYSWNRERIVHVRFRAREPLIQP